MGWHGVTLLGLTTLATLVTSYHVPDHQLLPPHQKRFLSSNEATFQRFSVESRPATFNLDTNDANLEFGSMRMPLRDAVEALPADSGIFIKSQPLREAIEFIPERAEFKSGGLRDAVERRPPPPLGREIISPNSIWLEQLAAPTIRRHQDLQAQILCHFESTAIRRREPFSLLPHAIPSRKCSHIIYNGATTLDPYNSIITSKNPEYDEDEGGFKAIVGLGRRDPWSRVLVSIELQNHFPCCQQLSQSILAFVEKHGFDGIVIEWANATRNDLKSLLVSLRGSFATKGFIIAVAQGPHDPVDAEIASESDMLILYAWESINLNQKPKESYYPATLKFASNLVEQWTDAGIEANKIILSVPLFGNSFTMKYKNKTNAGDPVIGYGMEGPYTKIKGAMAYYEICDKMNQDASWSGGREEEGAYLIRGDQWIGYDDPISVKFKVAYIKNMGLGGISLYSLDLDDFVGICGDPWPLLNIVVNDFHSIDDYDDATAVRQCQQDGTFADPENCASFFICKNKKLYRHHCDLKRFFNANLKRCVTASPDICKPEYHEQLSPFYKSAERYQKYKLPEMRMRDSRVKVICYVTSWAIYRKDKAKFVPENLDTRLCSHIIYAFAGLNPDHLTMQPFDPWADIENQLYERVTSIGGSGTGKVLLALGGWTDSSGDKYSRLINSPTARANFISNAIDFLERFNFQGISIEWNYPKCWQSDCAKGPDSDGPNFTKFIQELRKAFDKTEPRLILAISISGYKEIIDRAYDVKKLSDAAEFISVMTFDFAGAWESTTGHPAPLYAESHHSNPHYNINWTMSYLSSLGADRSKLLPGIAFYGQTYRLSQPKFSQLGESATGPGMPGEFTRQPGMLAYYEICDRIKRQGWKVGPGPSAQYKDQFVSYDDPASVAKKGQWVVQNGYGGATAWTVDLDDFTNKCCLEPFPLLRSLNRALGRYVDLPPPGGSCTTPNEPVTPSPPTMTAHSDADDGGSRPTRPMASSTTSKSTTWPTWTETPSKKPTTTTTSWPTWVWTEPSTTVREEELTTVTTKKPKTTTTRKPSTTTTKKPKTTTTKRPRPTTDESVETVAKQCQHGQYYASPQSCTGFLICVDNDLVLRECGTGLNWNNEKRMCDWAYLNPCKKRPNKISALVTKDMDKREECVGNTISSVPGNCNSYYSCVWGKNQLYDCPPGLHFNSESSICDWPIRAKCHTSSEPSITQSPDIDEEKPITIAPPKPSRKPTTTASPKPSRRPTMTASPKPSRKPTIMVPTTPSKKPTTIAPIATSVTPLPSAEIDSNEVSPLSGHYKVVCYFTNWAWYRRGIGKYLPEHIDHTLCTHIIYGFAVLDYSELTIKAHDSWADYDNRFYERVVAYKKRGLKVLLALGGWNDSAGDKYSRLVNSPSSRRKFIEHAIKFITKYGFDGLDLDWEYPVCWQVECTKGPLSDKEGFAALLEELSSEFKPRGLLLSAAVSPNKKVIDRGYDVPALAKYLDWISVMTYDYNGAWNKKTGHVAPLYHHPEDEVYYFNSNYTINYWISKGAPPRKIVMGMPLYGQSFTINDPNAGTGFNVAASTGGTAGEFTKASGFLAYYEICDRINNRGWQVVQDPYRLIGPYAHKGNQWVGFDDQDMIRQKSQFIRDMGLGGGMVWALDLDDFRGKCGYGKHPLLRTIQQVLSDPPNEYDRPIQTPAIGQDIDWNPNEMSPPKSEKQIEVVSNNDEYKVVCYFTNWAWYRQGIGKFLPEDIDADLCTHIIYGFAVLDYSELTIKTHDSWADLDNKFYERVVAYKKRGLKVLLAIGGWNDSAGDKYSRLVNSPSARRKFIDHVVKFIEKYGFDGLDLDWEYPVCWQVDCKKGPKSDKKSFTTFVKELSDTFKPKGLLLSSAVSPSERVIDAGYDVPQLAEYLDWISIMAYDYHGQWDKKTGHVAPLYVRPDDWERTFNANTTIHYWMKKGAPPKKLVMGMPLYGQSFTINDPRAGTGLNTPANSGGTAGEYTRASGFLAYYEICDNIRNGQWKVTKDPDHRIGPYATKGDQWVSFDDVEQIQLKSEIIKKLGLGGGMVWALDLDDFKNRCQCEPSPLLRTINRVLRNYPAGPKCTIIPHNIEDISSEQYSTTVESILTSSTTVESTDTAEPDDSVEVVAGPQPPPMLPIGECEGELFLPHKEDCSKYLLCNFGQFYERSCPNNLYWNKDHCDWPENTECKKAAFKN